MKYTLRTLLVVIAVVGVLMLMARIAARAVKPSIGYGVRAQFTELPNDDSSLEAWLREQPGVVRVYVNRDADVNAIRVYWIMSRDLTGSPPAPDLRAKFTQFGYKGITSYDGNWVDQ